MKTRVLLRVQRFPVTGALIELGRDWLGRFVAVQGLDRAMAIGAQAYTALFPLLIVYVSFSPLRSGKSFSHVLIDHLKLDDGAAASVRQAFAPSGTVQSGVTLLGVVLLLVSGLAFTRGLQRLYEGAFALPTLGLRNTNWDLLWLIVVSVLVSVRPVVLGGLSGKPETVVSLALSAALWLVTPYLLLGRRMHWTILAPVAALSTLGMTAAGIWSVLWIPHVLASSADQFGVIGIGFALLTWLVALAGVLVVAATGGATIADRLSRRAQHSRQPGTSAAGPASGRSLPE